MQQQQPNVTVISGGGQPGANLVIQTVGPSVTVPRQPRKRPTILPHKNLHVIFGVIQMVVGVTCFLLDVVTVCLVTRYMRFGAGIYSGIFFFIPGLLGFLAGRNNDTCCLIGCMVMNIIGSCVAVIGLSFASIEIAQYGIYPYASYSNFIHKKSIIILCLCLFEFVFTIIHSSMTCASCCLCCMPREMVTQPPETTTTTVQTPQVVSAYPQHQQPLIAAPYPQHQQPHVVPPYPQQQQQYVVSSYPQQQQQYVLPPQHSQAPVSSHGELSYQGGQQIPPYNPAFGHDSQYPDCPPPYSENEKS